MTQEYLWWQTDVVYQIYPRSFMDSNGDGVGDLPGITQKLDYLHELGVHAIWISPIFPSPMADFGYDVADYTGIEPMFGTMDDFDTLLAEVHKRGMKLLLDFVPNHSSDEHPWFKESRSSRDNPKRDWYIWHDPAPDGGVPNNWWSYFGGSAWEYDEQTEQYYLHLFDRKQADLNWRNPDVCEAMLDNLRFWFDKGVDGFRIDVIFLMIKDDQFRDNPDNPDWTDDDYPWDKHISIYSGDRPEVHEVIREMRQVADEYDDRVLIGEIYLPIERLMAYYGDNLKGVHLPFNFQLQLLDSWDAQTIRQIVDAYEAALPEGGWPNWVLGNHDQPRIATRIGLQQARIAQMLLLTSRGTPTCYYGDELGMQNVTVPPEQAHDPQGKEAGHYGRDPYRTPMQWDSSANAGFTTGDSWLPLSDDYETRNVAAQSDDATSMLSLVRRLLALRNDSPALTIGNYIPFNQDNEAVYAYIRVQGDQHLVIALNFTGEEQQVDLSKVGMHGKIICSTHLDRDDDVQLGAVALRSDEGVIIDIDQG